MVIRFLLALMFISCAHDTVVDKKYKCMVQLVEQGVEAGKAAEACQYTFKNAAPEGFPGSK